MDMCLTPLQYELAGTARRLAVDHFAPRAARLDRDAAFPFEDYDDLRARPAGPACRLPPAMGSPR